MRITDVETYALEVPIGREVGDSRLSITEVIWIVVELHTDDGAVGTGWMASLGYGPDLMQQFVESQFADQLIGRDPFETEAIRRDLRHQTIYYGELGLSAWPRGAIDVACWDLKGKATGQPLFRLLGGDRDRIRAYASSMDTSHGLDELRDLHGGQIEQGFDAVKTKLGNRPLDEEVARIAAVREAIGDEADLFVDANQAWTVKEALEVVNAIDAYDIGWVEEPISEFDHAGNARLADRIDPPLATGEMLYRPEQFGHLLSRGGMEIAQPDLIRSGGVSGQIECARFAHRHGVPVASHFYYAVSAHVIAAAPNAMIVEYIPEYDIAPILETPPVIEDGEIHLPDRPGHGYIIDPEARAEYGVSLD